MDLDSSGKRTRSSEGWRKRRALTSFPNLALASRFASQARVTLLSRRECSQAVTIFILLCWRWLDRHHNGSLNSKRTHTPKSICQVLKSPFALDIWARADKIVQSLLRSKTCQFQSLLRDSSPIIGRNRSVSW